MTGIAFACYLDDYVNFALQVVIINIFLHIIKTLRSRVKANSLQGW